MRRQDAGRVFGVKVAGFATALLIAGTLPMAAQELSKADLRAVFLSCRPDYQQFCSGVKPGDGAIVACLRQHQSELSQGCRDAAEKAQNDKLAEKAATASGTQVLTTGVATPDAATSGAAATAELPLPPGVTVLHDIAYAPDAKQRFDVYLPADAARQAGTAPILVMVHGGAWLYGNKTSVGVVGNKAAFWLAKGYVFISVDNRLVPEADPLTQAQDVAAALAKIQQDAATWRADGKRLVLMGHSAGAHLVTLVSADTVLATKAGVTPWLGTVSLDSAAVDVPAIMQRLHPHFYDKAFGKDAGYWQTVSPIDHLAAKPMPFLMVCSSQRTDSCSPAQDFVGKVTSLGGTASVLIENLDHEQINKELGLPGDYTDKVEAFIRSLGLP